MATEGTQIEFNSNVAVLIRCNKIIDAINDARFRTTQKDDSGNPLAEAEEVLSHIICLWKEISVEYLSSAKSEEIFNEEGTELWNALTELRDKLRMNPPKPRLEYMAYWRITIAKIDDLDLKTRGMAKKKGFLSSNKKDHKKSVLRT